MRATFMTTSEDERNADKTSEQRRTVAGEGGGVSGGDLICKQKERRSGRDDGALMKFRRHEVSWGVERELKHAADVRRGFDKSLRHLVC
jgi:hypothetical protein